MIPENLTVPKATARYAVSGAVHYVKHIVEKITNFKDAIAIGDSGYSNARGVLVYHVQNDSKETIIHRVGA